MQLDRADIETVGNRTAAALTTARHLFPDVHACSFHRGRDREFVFRFIVGFTGCFRQTKVIRKAAYLCKDILS